MRNLSKTRNLLSPCILTKANALIFLFAIVFASNLFALSYSTVKAGNWNDASVWSPAAVPGTGDTVAINHNVNVNIDVTVGHSPQAGNVTPAISINGTLTAVTIASGKTLRCRGDLKINPASGQQAFLGMLEGSSLVFDPSQAVTPSTAAYQLIFKEHSRLVSAGTSGSRCTVRTDRTGGGAPAYMTAGQGGYDQGVQFAVYTDFNDLGNSADFGVVWQSSAGSSTTGMTIAGCKFSYSSCKLDCNGTVSGTICFTGNKFENSVPVAFWGDNECFFGGFQTPKTGGTRKIYSNVFDTMIYFSYTQGLEITDNYLGSSYYIYFHDYDIFKNNFIELNDTNNSSPIGRDMSDCFVAHSGSSNPHYLGCKPDGGDSIVISGFVVEYLNNTPDGDVFYAACPPAPGGTFTIKNCIKLPNAAGESSGCLISALGNENITIKFEHNTMHLGGEVDSSGARVGETYPGHTGMLASYKSNLSWDTTVRGYKLCAAWQTSVPDIVSAANCDYNGGYNNAVGSNGKGYHYLLFSSGSPGVHDIAADPQFVDKDRDLAKWAVFMGSSAGTDSGKWADGRAYLKANPLLTASSLLPYIRAGFVPQNPLYRFAGHDGADMGAVSMAGVPATSYSLTGAMSGSVSVPIVISVIPNGTFTGHVNFSDGGEGGSFSPASLSWTGGDTAQQFTYTNISPKTITLNFSNDAGLTDPAPKILLITKAPPTLASLLVYPVPARIPNSTVKFANLVSDSSIDIFSMSGERVKSIYAGNSAGTVSWDGKNESGDLVATGMFVYVVKDPAGNKRTGKLAIIKQ